MQMRIGVLFVAVALLAGGQAFAGPDDVKWINKCIADNANEGAKPEVVRAYCECMNDKMDDKETKSISNWERTHPDERKACEAKAGWK